EVHGAARAERVARQARDERDEDDRSGEPEPDARPGARPGEPGDLADELRFAERRALRRLELGRRLGARGPRRPLAGVSARPQPGGVGLLEGAQECDRLRALLVHPREYTGIWTHVPARGSRNAFALRPTARAEPRVRSCGRPSVAGCASSRLQAA